MHMRCCNKTYNLMIAGRSADGITVLPFVSSINYYLFTTVSTIVSLQKIWNTFNVGMALLKKKQSNYRDFLFCGGRLGLYTKGVSK